MILTAVARFWIRFYVQRQLALDDAFILAGIGCMTCAMALLFMFDDKMYLVESLLAGHSLLDLPSNFIEQALDFQKWILIAGILTWTAITCVKLSFLCLFWKLIDRLQGMRTYWYIVCLYTLVVFGYGFAVYFLACPNLNSIAIGSYHPFIIKNRSNILLVSCVTPSGVDRMVRYSLVQMALDAFGDALSKRSSPRSPSLQR